LGDEIALDHGRAGMAALPGLDEVETQRPGFGILAQDAGGDEEKLAHDVAPILLAAPLRLCGSRDRSLYPSMELLKFRPCPSTLSISHAGARSLDQLRILMAIAE